MTKLNLLHDDFVVTLLPSVDFLQPFPTQIILFQKKKGSCLPSLKNRVKNVRPQMAFKVCQENRPLDTHFKLFSL